MKAEFHCHTIYSKDSLMRVETLLKACDRKGIARIAITDHNETAGALAAQKLDPQRVIVGEEILTTQGELLAYFVKEHIPAKLPPMEVVKRLREQDAFISVAHPFDTTRKQHWSEESLEPILPLLDGFEVFNARCLKMQPNQLAMAYAQKHNLLHMVGSDAHFAYELGRSTLDIADFSNRQEMRAAVKAAQASVKLSGSWVHFYSLYAKWYKKIFKKRQA